MKKVIAGSASFMSGSIIFAACMICASFEGVVPADVQGERLFAILLMLIGAATVVYELLHEKIK